MIRLKSLSTNILTNVLTKALTKLDKGFINFLSFLYTNSIYTFGLLGIIFSVLTTLSVISGSFLVSGIFLSIALGSLWLDSILRIKQNN